MTDYEEFEYWENKYIEMFGEDALFSTHPMGCDWAVQIFKDAIKNKKPYKNDVPKGAFI
ncbi:MAG: hypothetical protein NC041_10045 [Bacteroides sp.]|nr:hypothetical protein [Prevotella sp.]MCM1408847.1 hypothetical protein [Treponema brennaborense]MCM1470793.1 hypothetical protein [Bacteroides sp.]